MVLRKLFLITWDCLEDGGLSMGCDEVCAAAAALNEIRFPLVFSLIAFIVGC